MRQVMGKVQGHEASVDKSRFRHRSDLKTQLVDREMIVLDRQQGLVHQLNKTASYIWEQCDGQRTAAEIASQLCESFEVDSPTALNDVLEVLKTLQDLKLIERV
jgi:hypothetical protein